MDALLSLKNAGVTKPVIDAMLDRQAKAAPNQTPSAPAIGEHLMPAADTSVSATKREQKLVDPAIYVEEVSSSGGTVASSDTALEAIKTLQDKHVRVVTIKDRADFACGGGSCLKDELRPFTAVTVPLIQKNSMTCMDGQWSTL